MEQGLQTDFWGSSTEEKHYETFGSRSDSPIYRPEVLKTVENAIASLDSGLRALSLDMHGHPEVRWEEHRTHDILSGYMEMQPGWTVTKHHILPTAWKATFTYGSGGRTLGINSEEDALPGIGHACGHNLIAISGIAVACAMKAALEKHDVPGTIVLLGTPAEEGGGGKVKLLDSGAYEGMDACLMCHPAPGPRYSGSLSSCLARQIINVEFFGHTAHAALSPWEGRNAVDAAVMAYNSIAMLRQQLRPTHRVHGIFVGKDWTPNIIPEYAKMVWYVRAPTRAEMDAAVKRVIPCFEGAGLATGCEVKVELAGATFDLRQNKGLGDEFATVFGSRYGPIDYAFGISSASTDFGNVTYALPALHPSFGIPTVPNGGNHTAAFAEAAATVEAHRACLNVSKALAATGVRVLDDSFFFEKVKETFEEDCQIRVAEVRKN
ncbi:aminoacylase 1-like protein 2 [Amylocystis lapponica]|nr:aminoacylase 1-like protein 2 [Amylocystis lapponica]